MVLHLSTQPCPRCGARIRDPELHDLKFHPETLRKTPKRVSDKKGPVDDFQRTLTPP